MPSVTADGDRSPVHDVVVKRKRADSSTSDSSRSPSPPPRRRRSASPPPDAAVVKATKMDLAKSDAAATAAATAAKGEQLRQTLAKLSSTRAGGAYIPPARLRALMAEAEAADPGSVEYQRMSWDALKKSVTGLVNKVAADNIKHIVPELFGGANLIRGRGLFCRSIMKAQMLSLPFTPVFAALVSIVNTKLPMVGELLVVRLVSQFRRSFKRNDKTVCHSTSMFIAHLVNQRVAHEIVALQILVLLLEKPTDDSVEIAVGFMREVGAFLAEEAPKANNSVYDRFRAVLHEASISKRVQYMIEVLAQVRREKYKDNPRIPEELDLVEEEDQITHRISLDDELNVEEGLNIFKADPEYLDNEEKYKEIKAEILGEASDEDDSDAESGSDESDSEDEVAEQERLDIEDRTETNMVNLRRTIYLTIMSSLDFEEGVHKLMKLNIPEGKEIELCNMIIECCSQERSYSKFYGHMGERLSKLNRIWSENFEQSFRNYYETIHRYETNRLRNIGRFFGSLIASDSISWACFEIIHMNEEDTTSSSRIFTKILFQEMNEILGLKTLVERFNEPTMQEAYINIFPRDNPKNTRFSINYFTSIGLGALSEGMREHLKNAPKLIMAQRQAALADASSDSDSSSSDSDSDSDLDSSSTLSSSDSGSSRSRSRSRSPPRRSYRSPPRRERRDAFSPDRSPSPPPGGRDSRRPRSDSRSPPPRRRASPSPRRYRDDSPPARERSRRDSRSRSPAPAPRRDRRPADSRSRSPPPPPAPRNGASSSKYADRSPPPHMRGGAARRASPPPPLRRRREDSRERDRSPVSPPPPTRRRYDDREEDRYARRSPPRREDRYRGGGGGGSGSGRDRDDGYRPRSPPPRR